MASTSLRTTNQQANLDLLEAVKSNDEAKALAALAEAGVDVKCREDTSDRYTPLRRAIHSKNVNVVRVFLKDPRVNVNAADLLGRTPLHFARGECLDLLFERTGVDCNVADKIGQTPLLWFARIDEDEPLSRLIGVESVDMLATTMDGFTALHQVAERNSTFPKWISGQDDQIQRRCNIVDLFLRGLEKKGHDLARFVNARNILYRSALHYIAEEGCVELLKPLMDKCSGGMKVNGLDVHDFTPLHLAVRKGQIGVVDLLLPVEGINANVGNTLIPTPERRIFPRRHRPTVVELQEESANLQEKSTELRGMLTTIHNPIV